jgi:predicted helicase
LYSGGVSTARDFWVINSSDKILLKNMQNTITFCKNADLNNIDMDLTKIKWSSGLKSKIKNQIPKFDKNALRKSLHRPFFKQWLYFDDMFNERQSQIPNIIPNDKTNNLLICISGAGINNEFSVVITNLIPNGDVVFHSQCFPRYTYTQNQKQDNILDSTLNTYQNHYKNSKLTKDNIFYYVYGILHSTRYREKYKTNLKKQSPHIPMAKQFTEISDIGRKLANLHLHYDTGKRCKIKRVTTKSFDSKNINYFKVRKMRFDKTDKSILYYNDYIKLEKIPPETHLHTIDGRTPLEWLVDRYRIKKDPDSGIVNDPNLWFEKPEELLDLIECVIYSSVETVKLIKKLSSYFI